METIPVHGIWGPVTATLDWCEANYQFSHYIAELANSFSNIVTVALALYGTLSVFRETLPVRYVAGFVGFALVGIGSFAFHATLLYEAQLADELPMIYVASYCNAVLWDIKPGFEQHSARIRNLLLSSLLFDILFTWSYACYRNPVYHQVVFAILMFCVTARTTYLVGYSDFSRRIPEKKKSITRRLFGTGAAVFAFGFFVWNLDNIFCSTLTNWKRTIGWPTAFLLEGHSWWHIMTAAGTYYMLIGSSCITLCIKDDHHKFMVDYWLGLPFIRRLDRCIIGSPDGTASPPKSRMLD
ncbi:alkaline phytoceramidase [Dentipellis sp. KUC8613]|nr:alkaline phytoceramidase [Dentipellis sp. KUC8613]